MSAIYMRYNSCLRLNLSATCQLKFETETNISNRKWKKYNIQTNECHWTCYVCWKNGISSWETNIVLIDNKFKFKIKFNEKDEYSRMSIMCKTVICFKENVDNLSINLCVIPISIQCRQNLLPFPIVSISPPYPFIRYN